LRTIAAHLVFGKGFAALAKATALRVKQHPKRLQHNATIHTEIFLQFAAIRSMAGRDDYLQIVKPTQSYTG
jgi:hypothetical protein